MQRHDRIFLAGHNGMVGSALLRALSGAGFKNIVTASRSEVDLRDAKSVEEFLQHHRPAGVIIAAAKVGGIMANRSSPSEFLYDNLMIQSNVIHHSQRAGVRSLLFLGSSCIYPRECPQPMREEYLLTGLLEPTNEGYALAKIAGLRMAQYYAREYGMRVWCPMPCNLYGPRDSFDPENSHVLSALVRKFVDAAAAGAPQVTLWGTGVARREFLHVDDLAAALVLIMEKWDSSEIINVGCGDDVTIKDLASLIGKMAGYSGEIVWDKTKPDGMLRKCLDVSKLNMLGFRPTINLEHGIRQMIAEYKERKST